ncbi:MAG: glutamine-synthetase adenylyltransferase, partial [Sulfitobacter sp.]|nr:glutamine-synthetase adenylyltransferase [Sulfitobacter sp.]
ATSIESYTSYQREEAWVWEHLALTRSEVIAGPEGLAREVEAVRIEILSAKRDISHICQQTAEMRARIAAAKTPEGLLDAKIGAGRLQDIELFAQAGALAGGTAARDIPAGLAAARECGLLDDEGAAALTTAYETLWALQSATRLLSSRPLNMEALRAATLRFLVQAVGNSAENDSAQDMETLLAQTYATADRIITAALAAQSSGET